MKSVLLNRATAGVIITITKAPSSALMGWRLQTWWHSVHGRHRTTIVPPHRYPIRCWAVACSGNVWSALPQPNSTGVICAMA